MPSTLTLQSSRGQHELTFFTFPGGERHVRLPESALQSADASWTITAELFSAEGVLDLMLLTDAVRRVIPKGAELHLNMPYIPYARQDRVAVPGEPFSAAVFCRLINSLDFSSVTVADPHSKVCVGLLERLVVLSAAAHVKRLVSQEGIFRQPFAVVAPDAGATARTTEVAKVLGVPVVYAEKKRDPVSGALSGAAIKSEVPDMPLLVVDDICDGGGTFVLLAQALREKTSQPLWLYVTHGIFSKGLAPLKANYDRVFAAYTADPSLRQDWMKAPQKLGA